MYHSAHAFIFHYMNHSACGIPYTDNTKMQSHGWIPIPALIRIPSCQAASRVHAMFTFWSAEANWEHVTYGADSSNLLIWGKGKQRNAGTSWAAPMSRRQACQLKTLNRSRDSPRCQMTIWNQGGILHQIPTYPISSILRRSLRAAAS